MIQRHVTHPANRFGRCRCGSLPRHIESRGRKACEPGLVFQPMVRHSLECPCGAATQLHNTLTEATAEWRAIFMAKPLHAQCRGRVVSWSAA